ncbi:MAG: hypothetical protein IT379_20200 [Deltaproteobacteria bacterium]|nr:hypothetical protein [Deltaproteobacteria bacterium]
MSLRTSLGKTLMGGTVALAVALAGACGGGAVLAGTPGSAGSRGGEGGCRAVSPCADGMRWDDATCRCVPLPARP